MKGQSRVAVVSVHGCPLGLPGSKDTGGMNVYLLSLSKELSRRGVRLDIFTRQHDAGHPAAVHLNDHVRIIHIPCGPTGTAKEKLYDHLPEFLCKLNRFVSDEGLEYDLVHAHYWLSGWVGMHLQRHWGVPLAVTFHTLAEIKLRARVGEAESQTRSAVEKQVLEAADLIVSLSPYERDQMVKLYGTSSHKIRVLPGGVDLGLFRPTDKEAARQALGVAGRKVLLYVGRIEPLKGIDILLRAVASLHNRDQVRVLIVGGDADSRESDRLRRMRDELGLETIVRFVEAVPQEKLVLYYNAADVCVMPSYYESFGLVAVEAMACGVPVVASRVGGLQGTVQDGGNGYLVNWHCPDPFAGCLEMLLENPMLRQALSVQARASVQRFGWAEVAQALVEEYGELTKNAAEQTRCRVATRR